MAARVIASAPDAPGDLAAAYRRLNAAYQQTLRYAEDVRRLYQQVQRSIYQYLLGLANALEAKDPYTRGHSGRVAGGALTIRYHHERCDGSGYPDGLAGDAIPIGARIVAVADVFDALTSDRPYRAALPRGAALDYLGRQAGRTLDERVVTAFLGLAPDLVPAPPHVGARAAPPAAGTPAR